MRNRLGDKQRLEHIKDSIFLIEEFIKGLSEEVFLENDLVKSGCVFQLQIIGEAANHLTQEFKNSYKETEWRQLTDLRNLIAHVYWGIDYIQIWEVINKDLVILSNQINKIIKELD